MCVHVCVHAWRVYVSVTMGLCVVEYVYVCVCEGGSVYVSVSVSGYL